MFKEILKDEINRLSAIINALCLARDGFDAKSVSDKYFQGLIDAQAALKNNLQALYMEAEIAELKAKQ